MPLFRFPNGDLLEDSLKTTIIVKNRKQLRTEIENFYNLQNIVFTMEIAPYGEFDNYTYKINNFDKRIGWYTHSVTISTKTLTKQCVGFLSENLEE